MGPALAVLLMIAQEAPPSASNFTPEDVINATEIDVLEPGSAGPRVMRAQILLDRARFSPGEIDARYGEVLEIAVKGFQRSKGLEVTGTIDPETWELLNRDTTPLFQTYTITAADVQGPFTPLPKNVHERARLKRLGYESAAEKLGEKYHISPKLLAELNPGKEFGQAGEQIAVPNVRRTAVGAASRIAVSESARTITVFDANRRVVGQYPITIGGQHDPLPIGTIAIDTIQRNPVFYYQPGRLWMVNKSDAEEVLPPGPNNPVGVVWMGLSKQHYGIHGTAEPSRIRKTESSGCIRLTNWDADDLSRMVHHGTPVALEE